MKRKLIHLILILSMLSSFTISVSAEENESKNAVAPIGTIAAGNAHSVWLRDNGTVGAVGLMRTGRNEISKWKSIVKIVAHQHTVGLLSDGTVIATRGTEGINNIENWMDIVDIDTDFYNTIGLTSQGTVVCAGRNTYGQCDTSSWEDIIDVAVGTRTAYGLRADGTVISVGSNNSFQRDVDGWTDIVAISAGSYYVVGLKSDGTVVGAGLCPEDLRFWSDIVAIDGGASHVVGLRSDGTVIAAGDNEYGKCSVGGWTNVVAISGGLHHTLALQEDGKLVAAGSNGCNQSKLRNATR